MANALVALIILLSFPIGNSFMPTVVDTLSTDLTSAVSLYRNALVPDNFDTVAAASVSIAVAEFVAGAVGGIASRSAAEVIGDKKKDSIETKVTTTSTFFGVRGLLTAISRLSGLPQPVAVVCAVTLGTLVSEIAKSVGRNNDNLLRPLEEEKESLEAPEIFGDISRWLSYSAIFHSVPHDLNSLVDNTVVGFGCGSLAGVIGLSVNVMLTAMTNKQTTELPIYCDTSNSNANYLNKKHNETKSIGNKVTWSLSRFIKKPFDENRNSKVPYNNSSLPKSENNYKELPKRLFQNGLEAGVLFGCFELTLRLFSDVLPEGEHVMVPFYSILGEIIQDLPVIADEIEKL